MPSVLALGSGGSGQLGVGHTEEKVGVASLCKFDVSPPQPSLPSTLVGGANHSLMLFDNGILYAAGDNSNGACGHHLHSKLLIFHKVIIPSVEGFKFIAATWTTSVLVTSDDRVFVCGDGSKGELGLGSGTTEAQKPVEIVGFPPAGHSILHVAASFRHVVVVLVEKVSGLHTLWGWGTGRHGELGPDAKVLPGGLVWEPSLIRCLLDSQRKEPLEVRHISCGRNFSYIIEGSAGSLNPSNQGFVLGSTRHGIESSALSVLVEDMVPHATWSSVYLHLAQSGRITVHGKDQTLPIAKAGFPKVSVLKTGSEHAIAQLEDGRVVAWGWNEHLNCGKWDDLVQPDASSYNVLDESDGSYPLGCGCATTFYVKTGPRDIYPAKTIDATA